MVLKGNPIDGFYLSIGFVDGAQIENGHWDKVSGKDLFNGRLQNGLIVLA